jgi:hypothetical protein
VLFNRSAYSYALASLLFLTSPLFPQEKPDSETTSAPAAKAGSGEPKESNPLRLPSWVVLRFDVNTRTEFNLDSA